MTRDVTAMNAEQDIRKGIDGAPGNLEQVADEVMVKLHLAGMDVALASMCAATQNAQRGEPVHRSFAGRRGRYGTCSCTSRGQGRSPKESGVCVPFDREVLFR